MIVKRTDDSLVQAERPLHFQAGRLGSNPNDVGPLKIGNLRIYKLAGQ